MQAYSLCGGDPDYIVMLAEYVDAKMRSIADEDATADSTQLAVLAAVRIANECHVLKRKLDGGVSDSSTSNHSPEWKAWEKTMPEGGETKTSGEEVRSGRQPSPKPFTEEDRQRVRERRKRHHTNRWYEKQLLAIASGELVPTQEQQKALIAFGRARGWTRRSPAKR